MLQGLELVAGYPAAYPTTYGLQASARCAMSSPARIGGVLDLAALSALSDVPAGNALRMQHFNALSHDDQLAAIRSLAHEGQSEHAIARATGLSVEMIRSLLRQTSAGT